MTMIVNLPSLQRHLTVSPPRHSITMVELMAVLVAFWPIWWWYCERTFDKSDEPLGIVALITLIALTWSRRPKSTTQAEYLEGGHVVVMDRKSADYWICMLLLGSYCVALVVAPNAVQAVLATGVIGILLNRARSGDPLMPGDWLLLLLSLPLISSLSYYCGYPLRVLASNAASIMLNLGGISVHAQEATLVWNCASVSIDQPCSGIRMLWVALFLGATVCSIRRFGKIATVQLVTTSIIAALVANAFRVSSLFYLEAGIIVLSEPWHHIAHEGIGIISFVVAALIIIGAGLLKQNDLTKPSYSLSPNQPLDDKDLSSNGLESSFSKQVGHVFLLSQVRSRCSLARLCLFVFCVCAALLPLVPSKQRSLENSVAFSGWPTKFEGQPILVQRLSPQMARFADRLPGRLAVFTDGNKRIIFRWVTKPTRLLHPAENCYRASGYNIEWMPQYKDSNQNSWSLFKATKDGEALLVRERLFDEHGNSWTDNSAWYWSGVLQHSRAPWWSVCVVEPVIKK